MKRSQMGLLLILPGILLVVAIGAKAYFIDPRFGLRSFGAVVAATLYLGFCVLVSQKERLLPKLALSAWATLVALLLAGVALTLVRRAEDGDPRAKADAFQGQEWAEEYLEEFNCKAQWHPYVYWRRVPFDGKFIHVDEQGRRRTWNVGASSDEESVTRIYMFGGSTLWGTGVRDDHTVASLVSQILAESDQRVHVTNFGETGYVTTQNFIALILELRRGNVPDYVVFYDGVNDVFSAFQSGEPGIPQNEYNRIREFEETTGVESEARVSIMSEDELGQSTVDTYFATLDLVEALSQHYGFRALYYWQPVLYVDKPLTEYEQSVLDSMDPDRTQFFVDTYEKIREHAPPPRFRDLSSIFATVTDPLYIDQYHLSEAGNRIVAEQIAPDLIAALADERTAEGED